MHHTFLVIARVGYISMHQQPHQQPLADKHARSALIFVIDNRIADEGARQIAEAIKGMKNLKNLGLDSECQL